MKLDAIKDYFDKTNEEEDNDPGVAPLEGFPPSHRKIATSSSSFIFYNRSMDGPGVETFRPLASQMLFIWQTYVENVDPFFKIVHVPTVSKMVQDSGGNFDLLPSFMEPLMFSIAFAAIVSLIGEEVNAEPTMVL